MAVKQLILVPIYWGSWWLPENSGACNWLDVNGALTRVVTGRYMDGLNQYGIGRGTIASPYVYPIDPPADGFDDYQVQSMFELAIDAGNVPGPYDYDLETQQPLYLLIVRPGVEHLRDVMPDDQVRQWAQDAGTDGCHFGFRYEIRGRKWLGQACWIKGETTLDDTVGRCIRELVAVYTEDKGEASEKNPGQQVVFADGVLVPQYWSVDANGWWPPADSPSAER